jgi:hypothetical protein
MFRLTSLFVVGWTFCFAQQAGYLDLVTQSTRPRQVEPATASATVGNIGAGDSAVFTPRKELKLTVSRVELTDSEIGKTLIYEVNLQNTDNRAIVIPWTASPRDIEPAERRPYEYQMAKLAPRLIKSTGEEAGLEGTLIYGSDVSSTTYQLSPGQSVRIRAQTRLVPHPPHELESFFSSGEKAVHFGVMWSMQRVSVTEINGELHETFMPREPATVTTNTITVHIDIDGRH